MPTQRQQRVNNLLKREISEIILREMEDPHLAFLTVTDVEVSVDLRNANVYISVLGSEKEAIETIRTLRKAGGFIGGLLGDRLEMRRTPTLRFKLDQTAARAQQIEMLLRQAREQARPEAEPPSDPQ